MADTLLANRDASRLHASVQWTGERWEVRDHSRNGTLMDGTRIPAGKAVPLAAGTMLAFGRGDAAAWRVEDVARPSAQLWPLDGGEPIALARSNLLPEGPAAELSIFLSSPGRWVCASAQRTHDLEDGDEVRFSGKAWCFFSGADSTSTLEGAAGILPTQPPFLHFSISLDEEHTRLRLSHAGCALDLGERSHHYALLTLARLRLADAGRGIDAEAQGWVEQDRLAKMLGLDPAHLNIQIFRLRKQIVLALPREVPPPELVERRRGQLRLRDLGFRIMRGSCLQGSFEPQATDSTLPLEELLAF